MARVKDEMEEKRDKEVSSCKNPQIEQEGCMREIERVSLSMPTGRDPGYAVGAAWKYTEREGGN